MITYGMSMQSFLLTHFRPGNFEQDSQLGRVSPNGLLPETHFKILSKENKLLGVKVLQKIKIRVINKIFDHFHIIFPFFGILSYNDSGNDKVVKLGLLVER